MPRRKGSKNLTIEEKIAAVEQRIAELKEQLWPGTLVGRMMNGQVVWLYVLISFSFGLISILYSEKKILNGARRI